MPKLSQKHTNVFTWVRIYISNFEFTNPTSKRSDAAIFLIGTQMEKMLRRRPQIFFSCSMNNNLHAKSPTKRIQLQRHMNRRQLSIVSVVSCGCITTVKHEQCSYIYRIHILFSAFASYSFIRFSMFTVRYLIFDLLTHLHIRSRQETHFIYKADFSDNTTVHFYCNDLE